MKRSFSRQGPTATATSAAQQARSGVFSVLARRGQSGPGMVSGEFWASNTGSTFSYPMINAGGEVAFWGRIRTPGPVGTVYSSGVWRGDESGLQLVARAGTPISGQASLAVASIGQEQVAFNAQGDVVMSVVLQGLGVTEDNDAAIAWGEPGGAVSLLLREGQMVEVRPGVLKQVRTLEFIANSGGSDGRRMSLNDSRIFTAYVGFADGTNGVVVTVLPATGPAAAFAMAAGVAGMRRRR